MGALCCCFPVRYSPPSAENSNNSTGCLRPCCLFGNLFTKHGTLQRTEAQDAVAVAPSSTGQDAAASSASTTTSAVSANSSVTTRSQDSQANRDRVRDSAPQQTCQMVSAPLPFSAPAKSLPVTAYQKSMGSGEDNGTDATMEEKKLALMNGVVNDVFDYHHLLSEECPTCLEGYDSENPKIVTKCSHHFHLSCVYEWQERSDKCPICSRVMAFEETD